MNLSANLIVLTMKATNMNQLIEKLDREFDEYGLGKYSSEYGYEHKIPNYDKIKSYLHSRDSFLIQAIEESVEKLREQGDEPDYRKVLSILNNYKK